MKIYNYHPETGAMLGEGTADADPLEPERFLIPANATTTAPPAPGAGQFVVWTGIAWELRAVPPPPPPEPPAPSPTESELAKLRIEILEREQMMPRATREFMLTFMEVSFTPEQLALNYGYQAVKAFDNEIVALRAHL